MGNTPPAPSDSALSNAVTPRAARLKDCELRDSVPRALLSESSREIVVPGGGGETVAAGWDSSRVESRVESV